MLGIYKQRITYENVHSFFSTVGFEWKAGSLKGLLMRIPWNTVIKHLLNTCCVTPSGLQGRDMEKTQETCTNGKSTNNYYTSL